MSPQRDDDPTRRIEPPGRAPADPTRPIERDARQEGAEPTRRVERDTGQEGYAEPRTTPAQPAAPRRRRRGRGVLLFLLGAVLGFVAAFVVVALGTGDRPAGDEAALQDRIETLEAELDERDAQLADLEARLAEAEAAAGDRAEDVEAQRQSLDERAAALEEWAAALEERQAAVERREDEVAERERAVEDAPDVDLPDLDDETVDTIVERVLEGIRNLF